MREWTRLNDPNDPNKPHEFIITVGPENYEYLAYLADAMRDSNDPEIQQAIVIPSLKTNGILAPDPNDVPDACLFDDPNSWLEVVNVVSGIQALYDPNNPRIAMDRLAFENESGWKYYSQSWGLCDFDPNEFATAMGILEASFPNVEFWWYPAIIGENAYDLGYTEAVMWEVNYGLTTTPSRFIPNYKCISLRKNQCVYSCLPMQSLVDPCCSGPDCDPNCDTPDLSRMLQLIYLTEYTSSPDRVWWPYFSLPEVLDADCNNASWGFPTLVLYPAGARWARLSTRVDPAPASRLDVSVADMVDTLLYKGGDCNCDGVIDASDAAAIVDAVTAFNDPNDPESAIAEWEYAHDCYIFNADINCDGVVDGDDPNALDTYLADPNLPCGCETRGCWYWTGIGSANTFNVAGTREVECETLNGYWTDDPNAVGACDLPGCDCSFVNEAACTAAGGTWCGAGTHCTAAMRSCLGDANCDCSVDFFDIDPFVVAIASADDPDAWETWLTNNGYSPTCGYYEVNDINADGHVNTYDQDPFITLLLSGPTCEPGCP